MPLIIAGEINGFLVVGSMGIEISAGVPFDFF